MKIFTLFGDKILERKLTSAETAALIAASGNVITLQWDGKNEKGDTVGNGGYICIVETLIAGENKKLTRKIAVQK